MHDKEDAPPASPMRRTAREKDGWDKFSAVSTFLSGVVVTIVVAGAMLMFEQRQSKRREELRRIEILQGLLPYLADEELRETALLVIDVLGPHELALEISAQLGGEGADQALLRIAERAAAQSDNQELVNRAIQVRQQLIKLEPDLSTVGEQEEDGEQREITADEAISDTVSAGRPGPQLHDVLEELRQRNITVAEPDKKKLERELRWNRLRRIDSP